MASPMSTTMAARLPRRSSTWVPRSRSHPRRGETQGVAGVESVAHVEPTGGVRTDRLMQPKTTVRGVWWVRGPRGMRPKVDFKPKVPVKPAGMRMDPPPSPAVPRGRMPPETARPCLLRTLRGCVRDSTVARRAVEAGVCVVDATELTGRGLGREHGTGRRQSVHHRRAAGRHPVGEDQRCLGIGPSFDDVELLHPDGGHHRRAGRCRPGRPPHAPRRRRRG